MLYGFIAFLGIVGVYLMIRHFTEILSGKPGIFGVREIRDDGDETRKFVTGWIEKPDCASITYWVSMKVYASGDPAIEYFKEQKGVNVKVSEENTFNPGGELTH